MYGWSLDDWYPFVLIVFSEVVIGLAIITLSNIKKQREAQGKSGWFDKPRFTKYTRRKLGASLITVFGFTLMVLAAVAEAYGYSGIIYVGFLVGFISACFGGGLYQVINEDEQWEGVPWHLRRRHED